MKLSGRSHSLNPSLHFLRSRDVLDLDKGAGLTDQLTPLFAGYTGCHCNYKLLSGARVMPVSVWADPLAFCNAAS